MNPFADDSNVSPGGVFFKIPNEQDIQEELMKLTGSQKVEVHSPNKFAMEGTLFYEGKGVWKIYVSPRVWISFHKDDVLKVYGFSIHIK